MLGANDGLVAGALSMAAGEYVSVHAQADIEHAELARERAELAAGPGPSSRSSPPSPYNAA